MWASTHAVAVVASLWMICDSGSCDLAGRPFVAVAVAGNVDTMPFDPFAGGCIQRVVLAVPFDVT